MGRQRRVPLWHLSPWLVAVCLLVQFVCSFNSVGAQQIDILYGETLSVWQDHQEQMR